MKNKYKIISLYKDFSRIGGAEKVAVQVHKLLRHEYNNCYLMSSTRYKDVNELYKINASEYMQLNIFTIFKLRNLMVISHHRKNTTIFVILNSIFRLNITLIHVAHNEFFDLKYISFYPRKIIAVSNRVKNNLVSYYKVNCENISVIYNGVTDKFMSGIQGAVNLHLKKTNEIKILYGARITDVKGQIRLVNNLKGKIPANIKIDFAGRGDEEEGLAKLVAGDINFSYIGHIDFEKHLYKYDYVMLFSANEGLPLSLIEACCFGLPIICNNVGGNTEIVDDFENGFVVNGYDGLTKLLNGGVPNSQSDIYSKMARYSRKVYERKFREEAMLRNYSEYISRCLV